METTWVKIKLWNLWKLKKIKFFVSHKIHENVKIHENYKMDIHVSKSSGLVNEWMDGWLNEGTF